MRCSNHKDQSPSGVDRRLEALNLTQIIPPKNPCHSQQLLELIHDIIPSRIGIGTSPTHRIASLNQFLESLLNENESKLAFSRSLVYGIRRTWLMPMGKEKEVHLQHSH